MKMGFITGWYNSASLGSGASMFISELAKRLRETGIKVDIIIPQNGYCNSYHLDTAKRIFANLSISIGLTKKYDILLGFDYDGFIIAKSNRKIPFICCPRGILKEVATTEYGFYRFLLNLQGFFESINIKNSDLVVVPSIYAKKAIVKYYKEKSDKIEVIYNGIDVNNWTGCELSLNSKSQTVNVLSVGKFYPRKNIPILLKVFDILNKKLPKTRLHLVGDGIEYDYVCQLRESLSSKDNVIIHGFIDNKERLKELYYSSTIFCHLSKQETFGNVILEAMACGKPVFALKQASMPEIIKEEYNGFLVDSSDCNVIAENLLQVLIDPLKIKKCGFNAYKTAQEFSWSKTVGGYLSAIEKCIKSFKIRGGS